MPPTAPIPTQVAKVYDEIRSEVTWLHGRWICYRQLFAGSERRIEMLNERASTFFFIIQNVLLDEVQMTLSKLTDPAKTGKTGKTGSFENLSLEQLQVQLEAYGDPVIAAQTRKTLDLLHSPANAEGSGSRT